MKRTFSRAFVVICTAALLSQGEAKLASGSCPDLPSLPFDAAWQTNDMWYAHYVDKLVYNLYGLGWLIGANKIETLDCQTAQLSTSFDNNAYQAWLQQGTNGTLPAKVAFTWYEPTSKSLHIQGCVDAVTLGNFLKPILTGYKLPDYVNIGIDVASFILKYIHFQLNIVISQTRTLDEAAVTAI